jgi:hypothetical protein
MSIVYTYKVISVDEAARVMEVVYSAEGFPTQHIGVRLPYLGESLVDVVQMYAPLRFWEEMQMPVVAPPLGTQGIVRPTSADPVKET